MTFAAMDIRTRRSVLALLISVLCASAAGMLGFFTLSKQVWDITHEELDLGLLGLIEFAPAALLVLVTGTVADRVDRRLVAATAIALQTAVALALAFVALTHPTSPALIFALVFVLGIGRAFVAPAERSLPADIVEAEHLPWLIARFSGAWQAASIGGPILGGLLYAINPQSAYFAMAALLTIAGSTIVMVHTKPRPVTPVVEQPKPTLREAVQGLQFIRQRPIMLGAMSLDLFAVLFGGAIALLPALADTRLGVDARALGWLRAAGGIGAAITTAVLAVRPLRRRVGRVLLAVVAAFGVGTIVLGVTRNYAVAFIAMMVLSGADAVSVFVRATLVPLITPEALRGRVLAVENVFIGASNELGAFESGVAGHILGPAGAVVFGGAMTLAVASSWWWLFPSLRDVDEFPTADQ